MGPDPAGRALVTTLSLLPRTLLSRTAGRFARVPLPRTLQALENRAFARLVGADPSEARDPPESYRTLQAFFTRALRDGVRPIDPDPASVVSPCDGAWGASGTIERGALHQIKGRAYPIAKLVESEELASALEGGCYTTLYLAPRDYHRFHVPASGAFLRARTIPGSLWPVNAAGLRHVPELFCRNERIVAEYLPEGSAGRIALIAVGATIVGSVRVTFDDLTTNRGSTGVVERSYEEDPIAFAKGQEWGRFELGSTIVLAAEPGILTLHDRPEGSPVRLGESIGHLHAPPERDVPENFDPDPSG